MMFDPPIMRLILMLFTSVITLTMVNTQTNGFHFAANSRNVLGNVTNKNFTCDGRVYGYYADQGLECKAFHICSPIISSTGRLVKTLMFSFFCPEQTRFSQDSKTCIRERHAYPCENAHTLYAANKLIGQVSAVKSKKNVLRKKNTEFHSRNRVRPTSQLITTKKSSPNPNHRFNSGSSIANRKSVVTPKIAIENKQGKVNKITSLLEPPNHRGKQSSEKNLHLSDSDKNSKTSDLQQALFGKDSFLPKLSTKTVINNRRTKIIKSPLSSRSNNNSQQSSKNVPNRSGPNAPQIINNRKHQSDRQQAKRTNHARSDSNTQSTNVRVKSQPIAKNKNSFNKVVKKTSQSDFKSTISGHSQFTQGSTRSPPKPLHNTKFNRQKDNANVKNSFLTTTTESVREFDDDTIIDEELEELIGQIHQFEPDLSFIEEPSFNDRKISTHRTNNHRFGINDHVVFNEPADILMPPPPLPSLSPAKNPKVSREPFKTKTILNNHSSNNKQSSSLSKRVTINSKPIKIPSTNTRQNNKSQGHGRKVHINITPAINEKHETTRNTFFTTAKPRSTGILLPFKNRLTRITTDRPITTGINIPLPGNDFEDERVKITTEAPRTKIVVDRNQINRNSRPRATGRHLPIRIKQTRNQPKEVPNTISRTNNVNILSTNNLRDQRTEIVAEGLKTTGENISPIIQSRDQPKTTANLKPRTVGVRLPFSINRRNQKVNIKHTSSITQLRDQRTDETTPRSRTIGRNLPLPNILSGNQQLKLTTITPKSSGTNLPLSVNQIKDHTEITRNVQTTTVLPTIPIIQKNNVRKATDKINNRGTKRFNPISRIRNRISSRGRTSGSRTEIIESKTSSVQNSERNTKPEVSKRIQANPNSRIKNKVVRITPVSSDALTETVTTERVINDSNLKRTKPNKINEKVRKRIKSVTPITIPSKVINNNNPIIITTSKPHISPPKPKINRIRIVNRNRGSQTIRRPSSSRSQTPNNKDSSKVETNVKIAVENRNVKSGNQIKTIRNRILPNRVILNSNPVLRSNSRTSPKQSINKTERKKQSENKAKRTQRLDSLDELIKSLKSNPLPPGAIETILKNIPTFKGAHFIRHIVTKPKKKSSTKDKTPIIGKLHQGTSTVSIPIGSSVIKRVTGTKIPLRVDQSTIAPIFKLKTTKTVPITSHPIKESLIRGTSTRGTSIKGTPTRGTSIKGTPTRGTSIKGTPTRGTSIKGTPTRGTSTRGRRRFKGRTQIVRTEVGSNTERKTNTQVKDSSQSLNASPNVNTEKRIIKRKLIRTAIRNEVTNVRNSDIGRVGKISIRKLSNLSKEKIDETIIIPKFSRQAARNSGRTVTRKIVRKLEVTTERVPQTTFESIAIVEPKNKVQPDVKKINTTKRLKSIRRGRGRFLSSINNPSTTKSTLTSSDRTTTTTPISTHLASLKKNTFVRGRKIDSSVGIQIIDTESVSDDHKIESTPPSSEISRSSSSSTKRNRVVSRRRVVSRDGVSSTGRRDSFSRKSEIKHEVDESLNKHSKGLFSSFFDELTSVNRKNKPTIKDTHKFKAGDDSENKKKKLTIFDLFKTASVSTTASPLIDTFKRPQAVEENIHPVTGIKEVKRIRGKKRLLKKVTPVSKLRQINHDGKITPGLKLRVVGTSVKSSVSTNSNQEVDSNESIGKLQKNFSSQRQLSDLELEALQALTYANEPLVNRSGTRRKKLISRRKL